MPAATIPKSWGPRKRASANVKSSRPPVAPITWSTAHFALDAAVERSSVTECAEGVTSCAAVANQPPEPA